MIALLLAAEDKSGMPTTWPGAITAICFMILIGFMFWLFFRED